MAYLRAKNVHPYQTHPLTSTLLCIVILTSFLDVLQVEAQTADCRTNTEGCVCNSMSIVEYFGEILFVRPSVYAREPRVIYQSIERFQCTEYVPLPAQLLFRMADSGEELPQPYYFSKRKYRAKRSPSGSNSRQRRQLSLGVPSEELFQEAIATVPSSRSHHYAVLGSEVKMHCYGEGKNGWEEQGVSGSFRKFEWSHGQNQPITAPLVQFDQTTGDLTLMSVRLADTGIYTCTIKSGEQELGGRGDVDMKRFKSQLDVIASPMLWLRFSISYTVDRCRQKELLEIQKQIKDVIHQYICHFCPVRNISVNCVNMGRGGNDGNKYVEVSLTLSTLGLERLLPQWEHASMMCPVDCQEEMHSKVLSVLLTSLMKLFNLQIVVEAIDGKTSTYSPVPQSINDDIAIGCPSGFFENYKLCFPCAAGQYSPHGKSECVPCKEGFFQPNPGSSDCFRCPKGHSTLEKGSHSQMDCVFGAVKSTFQLAKDNWILVAGIGGGAGLLLLLIIMVCCCCPNSCLGKCFRCAGCCGDDESDNPEQKVSSKGDYGKLIPEQSEEEYYHNEEITEVHKGRGGRKHNRGRPMHDEEYHHNEEIERDEMHERRGGRHPNRGRPMKYSRVPRDEDYNYKIYDDDRRTHKNEISQPPHKPPPPPIKHETKPPNENDSFKQKLDSFEAKSASDKVRAHPRTFPKSPNRFLPQMQPPSPTNPPIRLLPICNYPIVDRSHHQLSEQAPARPYLEEEEDSDTSSRFRNIPHLKMGNVLNKSKSLAEKLGAQRRKLGETTSRSRSPSSESDRTSELFDSLSPQLHQSLLKRKNQKSSEKPRVNILEHKNTYRTFSDKDVNPSSKRKSRDPDYKVFKKPVSERIKSFQRGGKRR